MLTKEDSRQPTMEFVELDRLVPDDHILRYIDKWVNFAFIYDKVEHLYCLDNGRPALDPVQMFKMLFIGYLFGIRSERQLIREIEVNLAYRWFIGLNLQDKVPDASTFSQNRRRRFTDSTVYQEIFDEIVLQAQRKHMVKGKRLYTDSTHLKANANKQKFSKKKVLRESRAYLQDLEKAVDEDRLAHGKQPLKKKNDDDQPPVRKETKVSITDPDSGYMVRDGKPKGFFYLDHRTVDGTCGIITDTFVTAGNVHDSIPYLDRLDRQRTRFGFEVDAVGLDAGYWSAPICHGLVEREIFGVIGYCRPNHVEGLFRKREFVYDAINDVYRCPGGELLQYSTTNRDGYREYKSSPQVCKECAYLSRCTRSKNKTKVVIRHVWEEDKEQLTANRLSAEGKEIYARRKETVERSFADAKQLFGHRYARGRGKVRVQEQALLAATAQNIKKIAMWAERKLTNDSTTRTIALSFVLRTLRTIRNAGQQLFSDKWKQWAIQL